MEDWKKDLADFFTKLKKKKYRNEEKIKQKESEVDRFFSMVVAPAFEELKAELEKHGRNVSKWVVRGFAHITVEFEGDFEFTYGIRTSQKQAYPFSEFSFIEKVDGQKYRSEDTLAFKQRDFSDVSKEDIIRNFLYQYKQRVGGFFLD